MIPVRPRAVTITIDGAREVSGLLQVPPGAHVCYVLAHGAGSSLGHVFGWPSKQLAPKREIFKDFAKIWLRLALHFENENALLHIWSGSGRPKSLTSRRAA